MTKRWVALEPRRYWSAEEDALFLELYPNTRTEDLVPRFNRSLRALYARAKTIGLLKSAAFLASPASGRTNGRQGIGTRFVKGQTSHNKGKPFLVAAKHPNCRRTHFKKGQKGWNWKPVGSERLIGGYLYTKVSDRRRVPYTVNWKPNHVLLWEKRRGRIPPGHALKFVNGDRTDVRLKNLKLVSRGDLMLRNTVHNYPKPVARAIQLLGALNRKINRRSREEQDRRSA